MARYHSCKEFLEEIQPPFDKTEAIERHRLHRLTGDQVVVTGFGNTPIDDRTDSQFIIDPRNNSKMVQRSSCSDDRCRNCGHSGIIFD